ncbi:integrase [Amycolatopsis sp. NPDC051045]|uniref:tyrosine-type recombinase/integrase n=1 Tax=Amycolatopsis sp. NPDC051045 TaxID=3156922 RepID=UPI003431FEA2
MTTSHDVRIWSIETIKRVRKTTHRVRWIVAGEKFGEMFTEFALADSFRSKLMTAARKGEEFDTETGYPASLRRTQAETKTWFEFACEYMDMKWPDSSPKYRKSLVESLVAITTAMMREEYDGESATFRKALKVALNKNTREGGLTSELQHAINFAKKSSKTVGDLTSPEVLRSLLHALDMKLDGTRASTNTIRHRRTTLGNAIEYAVDEKKLLDSNPLDEVKVKKRKFTLHEVDPTSVINPIQARKLLSAVAESGKPGPPLVAFFGLMYYAALRPEEALNLKKENLSIPESGWGDLRLERARPEVEAEWTNSGEASEEGPLKHRAEKEGRNVPCPPELTALLQAHLSQFGTAPDGRLFRGARNGGRVRSTVYGRTWAAARGIVFTAEVAAGPLAKRPYDLRHAAVSTWLSGGVEPTRVAKWAGHSLSVLLRVYAKCLDGGEQAARDRVERALIGQ